MVSIDLNQAFYHIPLAQDQRNYFAFDFMGTRYTFTCLPFGLTASPRIFTKILRPVIKLARNMGIRLVIYLDDILIMAASKELALKHTDLVISLLQQLGFTINLEKSRLLPSQVVEYLGFQINSRSMMMKQNQRPNTRMQKGKGKEDDSNSEISFSHRKNISNNERNLPCQTQFSIPSKRQEYWAKDEGLERSHNVINRKSYTTGLVDRKAPKLEWKKPDSRNTNHNTLHRRINLRLGCVPGELRNSWQMVKTRTTTPHQYSRVDRDSVCNKDIQGHQGSDGHDKDGQHDLRSLHQPSGRYRFTDVINHSGGNMEPVFGTEYTYKSGTRTWCNEHNSRSSFEDKERSSRLEIMSEDIPDYRQDMGSTPLGSLCKPSQFSTPSVFFMDSGSGCGSHQRLPSDMVQNEPLGQSSMDLDTEDTIQIDKGKSNDDHIGTLVGDSTMVSVTPRSIDRTSISYSIQEDSSRGTESQTNPFRNPSWKLLACRLSGLGIKRKAFLRNLSIYSCQHWKRALQRRYHRILEHGFLGVDQTQLIPLFAI